MARAVQGLALTAVSLGLCLAQTRQAGYSAPGACAGCHKTIAEAYGRTAMGRSFRAVSASTNIPPVQGASFHHEPSGEFFSLSVRDGKTYLNRSQGGLDGAATNVLEASMDYAFGSGSHAVTYLHRTPSGELAELPLTWYAENGGHWGMSPSFDRPDHPGFSRKVSYRCMFCHNAYPALEAGAEESEASTRFPAQLPQGIDCQRCHGPGQAHVDAVKRGQSRNEIRKAIVNPAQLTPARQTEICLQCHLETTSLSFPWALTKYDRGVFSFRPGEPLENYMLHFDQALGDQAPDTGYDDKFELVSAPYRLRKSACFRASGDKLTCATCHDPHKSPDPTTASTYYARACQTCHVQAVAKLVSEGRHPSGPDCVSCHMPKRRAADAIHITVTDHYIRQRPDTGPFETLVERHDGNTPPYRGEVVPYYPAPLPHTAQNELYIAVAQVKQQANLARGLPQLAAAIAKYAPKQGEFYFELGEAYRDAGRLDQAIAAYQDACRRTPVWRHFYALGSAQLAAGNLQSAAASLNHARELAPREIVVLEALAAADSRQGKYEDAIAVLRAAIAMDPDSADARNNLGTVLLQLDKVPEAERMLRESVRLRPEMAAAHLNLADLLSRYGSFPEARYHFEEAIRLDGAFANAQAAYANALVANGDLPAARQHFEAALRLNPQLSEARNNLGSILLQSGDVQGAVREYQLAIAAHPDSAGAHYNLALALLRQGNSSDAEKSLETAIAFAPDFYEAHLKLGQILLSSKRANLAAPHLRKAAGSPDSVVRLAAQALLK